MSGRQPTASIPRPVLAKVSAVLADFHTHRQLDYLFDFQDAPLPADVGSNKNDKVFRFLMQAVKTEGYDELSLLGAVLCEFMESDPQPEPFGSAERAAWLVAEQAAVADVLKRYGLEYRSGGKVVRRAMSAAPARALEDFLRDKDLDSVDEAFRRAERNVVTDPPAALDAACSIVESCCKVYIEEHDDLRMPNDKSLKPVWKVVQEHLGWKPQSKEDDDIKRILGGLASVVDGIGALRTKAGAAHGRGKKRYRIEPRHARLAVHAAQTVVLLVLETWEAKQNAASNLGSDE